MAYCFWLEDLCNNQLIRSTELLFRFTALTATALVLGTITDATYKKDIPEYMKPFKISTDKFTNANGFRHKIIDISMTDKKEVDHFF